MTISTTTLLNSFSGNGSVVDFTYTYPINSASELLVIIKTDATGVETTKTLTSDYTVALAGDSGGTVTMGTAPASGETLFLIRNTTKTQGTDLIENDPFSAEGLEDSFDNLQMQIQEVSNAVDRSFKVSKTNSITTSEITTSAADRANKILSFDASGNVEATAFTNLDTLNEMTDVTITSPADNEVLAYDSSSTHFINQTAAEAGLVATGAVTGITSLLATDIKIGEDNETKIDFETADEIHFYAANAEQAYVADGVFGPQTDSDVDLGTTSVRWANAYIDSITTTGNITSAGTVSFGNITDGTITATAFVDEDDMSSDSATLIPTQQSVKAYVDAKKADMQFVLEDGDGTEVQIVKDSEVKFVEGGGIDINWTDTSTGSDADPFDLTFAIDSTVATLTGSQTLTNKTLTSPVLNTGVSGTAVKDEDNMASDSASHLATQQSIKAYVDAVTTSLNAQDLDVSDGSSAIGIDLDTETLGILGGTGLTSSASGNNVTLSVDAAQTGITSVTNASLVLGRDADNDIDFTTDNQITFRVSANDGVVFKASGEIEATSIDAVDGDFDGTLEADSITVGGTNLTAIYSPIAGSSNIVTTGALNSGSITSGFGNIDNGSSTITTTGVITGGTVEATADTSAGDNAAIGYTAAEGLILTGQGSTSDITLKNDADATVFTVPTGTDDILFPDNAKAMFGASSDLQIYHDGSNTHIKNSGSDFYVASEGSGNDLYLRADDDVFIQSQGGEHGVKVVGNGAVELYYDNNKKFETYTHGTKNTGNLWLTEDNGKGLFGANTDLQIFHDATDNIINNHSADLHIKHGSEFQAKFIQDGAVELYNNNTKRLETTASGVDVSGSVQLDDGGSLGFGGTNYKIEGSSAANHRIAFHTDGSERARFDSSGNFALGTTSTSSIRLQSVTPTANHLALQVENSNTSDSFGMVVKGGNDENDYTADFRKRDNTNIMRIRGDGKVGIGETLPLGKMHIKSADSGASVNGVADELVLENSSRSGMTILSGTSSIGTIAFGDSGSSTIGSINYDHSSNNLNFYANGSEAMRIDSSGNFLVNTTDTSLYNNSGGASDGGFSINNSRGSYVQIAREDGTPLFLNLLGSTDGALIDFRFDGTSIGSINSASNNLVIKSTASDKDILFQGNDGGSAITALTLDMSDAGTATFNHDIKLGNDQIAKFGAAANLQIYANSINSFITESGSSGNLKIQGQTIRLEKTTEEIMLRAVNDGQVELYYDNVIKVLTSSTGINLPVDGDSIKFGANSEVVLTHVHDSGLKITHDGGGDPDLILANTASASDGNQLGSVFFNGQNSNGDEHTYAFMLAQARDVTDGEEDGQLLFYGNKGGSDKQFITYGANANGASPTHEVCINEGSEDIDFRVESNDYTHALHVNAGNNSVSTGAIERAFGLFNVSSGDSNCTDANNEGDEFVIEVQNSINGGMSILTDQARAGNIFFGDQGANNRGIINYDHSADQMKFGTAGSIKGRFDSSGVFMVGTSSSDVGGNTTGVVIGDDGYGAFRRSGATVMYVNRFTDDGVLINLYGQGSIEGTIAVSGSTVSYNGFTGTHWSRLSDNSKPTILRGTIMDSIDEMCDWYQAVAEVAESTDDEGNVTPAHTVKESIALGDKSVGDAITFTSNGTEYTGTIVKEDDVKHTKCKVSDTADSKKVYGVFSNWDDADDGLDGDVNDMNIAQVGTYIIRVHKDVTVEAGDLLVSNGDGTAKKQDDDIIRSKTVAKVNSTVKIETYSDGSYTVPCTLHC